jgi:AraC-like DNA-binding protein
LVGDHSEAYGSDDLILLGPNLPHTWFSDNTCKENQALVVQFRAQLFPEPLQTLPQFASIRDLLIRSQHGVRFRGSTATEARQGLRKLVGRCDLSAWLGLAEILNHLSTCTGQDTLATPTYHHRRSYKLSSRLEQVTSYLEKNCREEVSQADAARIAGLSPTAFSRFFRKMTQTTFVDFRNSCRIREACRLLTETDLPITQIAYECGFGNLANFNRRFLKEKRIVPRQYRRLHNPQTPEQSSQL